MLVLGSSIDEAWQVLHHVSTIRNPLAIGSGLFAYVFSSLRAAALQSAMIARIHGAKSYSDLSKVAKSGVIFIYSLGILSVFYAVWFGWDQTQAAAWGFHQMIDKAGGPYRYFIQTMVWMLTVELVLLLLTVTALASILGVNFLSVMLSPWRWCAQRLGSLPSVFTAALTYGGRYLAWPMLVDMVMGLDGYGFKIPTVERQHPGSVPKNFIRYEDIPKAAEQRAKERRSAWVALHLADASETFSKLVVTAADLTSLLQTIEADQSLVHAAYYTEDECIARIADWIVGRG
jgi:hypothetical protein